MQLIQKALFLPNRKMMTEMFLPRLDHVPSDAQLRAVGFSFPQVEALGTVEQTVQIEPAFLALMLVGYGTDDAGFNVKIWHNTTAGSRELMNKAINSGAALGTAQHPFFIKEPYLMLRGDSLRCQVKSLSISATNAHIWVAFWGGDVTV